MTDCAICRELISQLMDGTLEADDAARVRSHLATCADCRATLEEYRRIGTAIRALPPIMPPAHLTEAIFAETIDADQRRLYLITNRLGYSLVAVAAVITVFLVAAYLLVGGYQRGIDPEVTASRPQDRESWPITRPIEITFNKAMDHDSVRAALGIQPSGEDQRLSQTWDGNTLTIGLNQPLKPGSTYIVKITEAASDKWGNHLSETFTLTFDTTSNIEAYRTPTAGITSTPSPTASPTSARATPTSAPTGIAVVPEQPGVVPAQPTARKPAPTGPPARQATATPGGDTSTDEWPATATPTPTATPTQLPPTATPTAQPPAPTVAPTQPPTATPSPTPTVPAPTVTPTVATIPVTGAIGDVYWANDSVQQGLGDALAASYTTDGLQLDFQHGTMLYRADRGAVYVLINNQLVWSTYSVISPAGPASTEGPEPGLWIPGGLLGAVWSDDATVSGTLGYALSADAVPFIATVQMFERGLVVVSPTSVYIFYDNGGWEFWPATSG